MSMTWARSTVKTWYSRCAGAGRAPSAQRDTASPRTTASRSTSTLSTLGTAPSASSPRYQSSTCPRFVHRPVHWTCSCRRDASFEVLVPVCGFEVYGNVGHDAGAGRRRRVDLVAGLRIRRLVRPDAIPSQKATDLLARRLPGDPDVVLRSAGLEQEPHRLCPVARISRPLTAAHGGESQRSGIEPAVAGVNVCASFEELPDDGCVPAIGGGVQRLLTESVASMRGEAEI